MKARGQILRRAPVAKPSQRLCRGPEKAPTYARPAIRVNKAAETTLSRSVLSAGGKADPIDARHSAPSGFHLAIPARSNFDELGKPKSLFSA